MDQHIVLVLCISTAQITPSRRLVWVVGNAVEQAFQPLVKQLNKVQGLTVELVALNSDY